MRVLFLDIDGVLNAHDRHANGYCGLHADKLDRLDRIVTATGCKIVVASAWRYLVLSGSMTLAGLGNLLYTHGASKTVVDALYDVLPEEPAELPDRGRLVTEWMRCRRATVVVVDDMDLGYSAAGLELVDPDSSIGLTDNEADKVIELLCRT